MNTVFGDVMLYNMLQR